MKNKIIIPVTGPVVKYRLEIMKRAFPDLLDFIILFTNKFSYDLYTEYHDVFNFILMDDYQDDFSKENEVFPDYKTEEEYFNNIKSFNGAVSLDISRFIFPYLMENNIYNFIITETDFIIRNDVKWLEDFFNSIPKGTMYAPSIGEDAFNNNSLIWNNIQPHFKDIILEYNEPLKMCDGYLRGFHFNNREDMSLYYDIYCEAMKHAIVPEKIQLTGTKLYYTDYVSHTIMQIFQKQKKYDFKCMWDFTLKERQHLAIHVCRPEDTFYSVKVSSWSDFYNLDHRNVTSIKEYIQKNKKQLKHYYECHGYQVELTDTHIFTSLK